MGYELRLVPGRLLDVSELGNFDRRRYNGRDYVINKPIFAFEPQVSEVENCLEQVLALTNIYPNHRIICSIVDGELQTQIESVANITRPIKNPFNLS